MNEKFYGIYLTRIGCEGQRVREKLQAISTDKEKAKNIATLLRGHRNTEELRFKDNFIVARISKDEYDIQHDKDLIKQFKADILNESKNCENGVSELVSAILPELTLDQLQEFRLSNLKFEKSAEEFISVSVHASVWTYYIEGSITINDKTFTKKVSYDSIVTKV